MSEFSNTKQIRLKKLKECALQLLKTGSAHSFIVKNKDFIPTIIPSDFITLFDEIIKEGHDINEVKALSNKLINIFYVPIKNYKRIVPDPDSFIGIMERNNHEMKHVLDKIKHVYKMFVKDIHDSTLKNQLLDLFLKLQNFSKQYLIKENVLFPVIEKSWPDYRCLQIMWSFHDDIRKNIELVIQQIKGKSLETKSFNRTVGDIFFNIQTIRFRDEHILFPYILSTISDNDLKGMVKLGKEIGYPYWTPDLLVYNDEKIKTDDGLINLGTGKVTIEQIKLIFDHLPVDITFVDEHNKVRFFSAPPKRIFPRTLAIIGREVSNCHPPESVHVVEKIVESFRKGEKDHADFWINMKGEFILIKYFAVRDEDGNYKGVLEVSQEVSDIRDLKGEKRLLDW